MANQPRSRQPHKAEPNKRNNYEIILLKAIQPLGLTIEIRELAIVIFPLFVFVFGDVMFELLGNYGVDIKFSVETLHPESEAANRYFFLSAYLALLSVTTGIFIYFVTDIIFCLTRKACCLVAAAGIVIIGVLVFSVFFRYGGHSPRTYFFVGQSLFEEALNSAPLPSFEHKTLLDAYNVMLKIDDIFIILAVPAVILGCISALAFTSSKIDRQHAILILSLQVRRVKTYLNLGAIFLVVMVVYLMAWMQLPSFLLSEEEAKLFDKLVRSISTYYGVQYLFVLCSYYIPVSFFLAKRIHALAFMAVSETDQPVNERTVKDWEVKSGLVVHDLKSYKTLAALFAPLLTGLIGGVLAAVGGK